jgi:hypothetical protein
MLIISRLCPNLPQQKQKEGYLSCLSKSTISKSWKKYFAILKNGFLNWFSESGTTRRVEITENAVISKISLPDANHVFAIIARASSFFFPTRDYFWEITPRKKFQRFS